VEESCDKRLAERHAVAPRVSFCLFSHFRRNFYAVMNSDIMTVKVIALLEDGDFGLPLQFTNFRD
jgi:hypothetical protein